MKKLKVLMVDDEPDIRIELNDFLLELGFEAVLAANGEEASPNSKASPTFILCFLI